MNANRELIFTVPCVFDDMFEAIPQLFWQNKTGLSDSQDLARGESNPNQDPILVNCL